MRIATRNEVCWRVSTSNPGRFTLRVKTAGGTGTKQLVSGRHAAAAWPARVRGRVLMRAANPGEPALRGSPLREIRISYPERTITVLGRAVHWLVVFFVLSLAAAYALRGVFRVSV